MDPVPVRCATCAATSNLWLCLTCGNIGCGRYDKAHALAHYERTSHSIAFDTATQNVWDYAYDDYVHRLLQNRSDYGPAPQAQIEGAPPTAKMENLSIEYTDLLASQLADQRQHFEDQLKEAQKREDKANERANEAEKRNQQAEGQLTYLQGSFDNLRKSIIPELESSKDRALKKATELEDQAAKASEQLTELRKELEGLNQHRVPSIERDRDDAVKRADQASDNAANAMAQSEELQRTYDALATDIVPTLERDKEKAERRAEKFEGLARKMEKEWREKDVINESLMDRISHLEKQVNEATLKASELEEQNRDLSFFISGMEKLKDQGDDIQQGKLSVPDPISTKKKRNGKR